MPIAGFSNLGQYWKKANYELDIELEPMVDKLYRQLEEFYTLLHAYVRHKLRQEFPDKNIGVTGPIPAHLLGKHCNINLRFQFNLTCQNSYQ